MIGLFDSGSGGLSVLKAIREQAPDVDIVYFGDTKNAPYGNKSREELATLTARGFHFLQQHGATQFVSACNSVSASVTEILLRPLRINSADVIEMSKPTIRHFANAPDAKILVVATVATIASHMYQDGFAEIGMSVDALPIPELAGAIERGEGDAIEKSVTDAFADRNLSSYTHMLLGCTHFPLVTNVFQKVVTNSGGAAVLVDPAVFVAEAVVTQFGQKGEAKTVCFTSSDAPVFEERFRALFGGSVSMNAS